MARPDGDDSDLIRFCCADCGKVLGAKPGMKLVVCSRCRLDNDVPTVQEARDSLSQPIRLVSLDLPFPQLLRLGSKLAVAAVPLVLLLSVAACGVVLFAGFVFDGGRVVEVPATVTPPGAAEPAARPGLWSVLVGMPLLLGGGFISAVIAAAVSRPQPNDPPLFIKLLVWFLLGVVPLVLGGLLCWRYFF